MHPAPDPQHLPLCVAEVLGPVAHDLRPVYTAATEAEAKARFEEFAEKWAGLTRDHQAVAERLVGVCALPGLRRGDPQDHLIDQRDRVVERPLPPCGAGPRAFLNEQAALKCSLTTRSLDPTGSGRARWAKVEARLNAFAITFPAASQQNDHRPDQIHRLPQWKHDRVRRARSTIFIAFVATVSSAARRTHRGLPVWLKRSVVIALTGICRLVDPCPVIW